MIGSQVQVINNKLSFTSSLNFLFKFIKINIIIIVFYIAPYSTEIALRCLTFKTQLKHILSSYRSNKFHT